MIYYVKGDATYPERNTPEKKNIIVHCCNDIGAWGAGFVLSLNKRWGMPMLEYKKHFRQMRLGDIQIVRVEENIAVCNLIGQHGIKESPKLKPIDYVLNPQKVCDYCNSKNNNQNNASSVPVDYNALREGFVKLKNKIKEKIDIAIHMPKIGCGLAGGDWQVVSNIVKSVFNDIDVYVYEF